MNLNLRRIARLGAASSLAATLFLSSAVVWETKPQALGSDIRGKVFLDDDGDGRLDPGEKGLGGVVISDQVSVVRTDSAGDYHLPDSEGFGVVFVSVPNGFSAKHGFWRKPGQGRADFALKKEDSPVDFSFIHASDTHISARSLPRLQAVREIVERLRPAFVLVTGDLVLDALRVPENLATEYYQLYRGEIEKFPSPVWSVPGNHENFGIERHRSLVSPDHPLYGKKMYRHFLGPNYYSFNFGGIHFVGLDTVDVDDLWYYGHVDEIQLKWLERDLAELDPGVPVVTFNHIPFFSSAMSLWGYNEDPPAPVLIKVDGETLFRHVVSNARKVLDLLQPRNYVLALGGHVHARERLNLEMEGFKVRFHQAAAVVAPNRTPAATLRSGITLYQVRGGIIDDGTFMEISR